MSDDKPENPRLFEALLHPDAPMGTHHPITDLTLRDLFAGFALLGDLASGEASVFESKAAESAYAYAEAMLVERQKQP